MKYCLTPRAACGLRRRAAKRGKPLPFPLDAASAEVAAFGDPEASPDLADEIADARGHLAEIVEAGDLPADSRAVEVGADGEEAFRIERIGQYRADGTASTCKARDAKDYTDLVVRPRGPLHFQPRVARNGRGAPCEVASALTQGGSTGCGDQAPHVLAEADGGDAIEVAEGVVWRRRFVLRRLTPTECERLQGFPDGWTDVPDANGMPASDGPRYHAMGNSMAVPVMKRIGEALARGLAGMASGDP